VLKVYRFVCKAEYADDFANGRIRLSTLDACRAYEDPLQGDSGEGTRVHELNKPMSGSFEDKEFVETAARAGIRVGQGARVEIRGTNTVSFRLANSFVLCTTNHFEPELLSDTFGKYCVEISDAEAFGKLITGSLESEGFKIRQALAGNVIYAPRHTYNHDRDNGPIGFVKPADPYVTQQEFRFVFVPHEDVPISPMFVNIPSAKTLCRRIA